MQVIKFNVARWLSPMVQTAKKLEIRLLEWAIVSPQNAPSILGKLAIIVRMLRHKNRCNDALLIQNKISKEVEVIERIFFHKFCFTYLIKIWRIYSIEKKGFMEFDSR